MIDSEYYYKLYNQATNGWLVSKDHTTNMQVWGKTFRTQKQAAQYLYRVARQVNSGKWHRPDSDINSVFVTDDWKVVCFKATSVDVATCVHLLDKKRSRQLSSKQLEKTASTLPALQL